MYGADEENESPPSMPSPKQPVTGIMASYSSKNCPLPKRAIVFSDTDNDVVCVENTLRFASVINKRGQLTEGVVGLDVVHTGDLVDKKNPDPAVAEYWERFRRFVDLRGCRVKIMAGNHELEAWQRLTQGETFGLPRKRLTRLLDFIETLDLFHVEDSVLFLHGYPTLAFLRTLLHFREVTGKDPNLFNEDHFRKAFRSAEAINQYAYVQGKAGDNYILADVAEARAYYKKHGRNVVTLLRELDIHTVIHGHRPQRSGRQADYEFAKSIPGVRMISNDTKVRIRGIGATVISVKPREEPDIVFINSLTDSKKTRSRVRELLQVGGAAPPSLPAEPPTMHESAAADRAEIQIVPKPSAVEPTTVIETAETGPIEVEPEPELPPAQPMITPESAESHPVQHADISGLSPEVSPIIPKPEAASPVEIAATSGLQPVESPDCIHTEANPVGETAPLPLQEGDSEEKNPRPLTSERKLRYWRPTRWRSRIGVAVLAASLAGLVIYWLNGKSQHEQDETQQALRKEKANAEHMPAEMARVRNEHR